MRLELVGSRVVKCTYENKMGANTKVNIPISTNSQINVPKEFKKGSVGSIVTKIMIGNPMQPLYIYLEELTTFKDVEADENTSENAETMVSLFKTICVPLANEKMKQTISNLCKVYNIPEIKMQKQEDATPKTNHFFN